MTSAAAAGRRARRRGRRGERIAARWLRARGYRVLARNVQSVGREVDLVVESPDGRQVVLVEVKSSLDPVAVLARRIDPRQLRRLESVARSMHAGSLVRRRPTRVDVMLVHIGSCWRHHVRHLRGESS